MGGDSVSNGVESETAVRNANSSPVHAQKSRSSSPAKRRASEMDGDTLQEDLDVMDVDSSSDAAGGNKVSLTNSNDRTSAVSSGTTPASIPGSSDGAADEASSTTHVDLEEEEPTPSIDAQVEMVRAQAFEGNLSESLPGYAVSMAWLARVIARSKYKDEMGPFEKSSIEGEIGPVDNSPILAQGPIDGSLKDESGLPFIPLKSGLRISQEFEILPHAAWQQIQQWYGIAPGQKAIIRYCHDVSEEGSGANNFQYELYPPVFTLRKLQYDKGVSGKVMEERMADAPRLVSSRSQKYQNFLKQVKSLLNIPLQTKIKVYRVLEPEQTSEINITRNDLSSMPSPPASREPSPARPRTQPKMVIDNNAFKALDGDTKVELLEFNDESMNVKYNGSLRLGTIGLSMDQVLIVQEISGKSSNDSRNGSLKKAVTKGLAVPDNAPSEASSGRVSPAAGMMTRGRNRSKGRTKGTVGLNNLGNTCYMNSALQCIRACEELTLYFLGNVWKRELNPNNPLGHRGQIATAYAQLLHMVYDENQLAVSPRNFKSTLGKYGPMFAGYGQQDSQEFMSFLVDGLHEDLNRIEKKPYIENPESNDDTVNDPDAIRELGEIFRKNHRARNDSVATDLFNGFYKNKLVCPECDKVSITFDPFSLLTLQLPIQNTWEVTFTFIPLRGVPFQLDIDDEKGSTMKSIKDFVASRVPGTAAEKMVMVEIFSHKVYRVMEDRMSIAEASILAKDDMVIYELEEAPTNYPPPKKKIRSMLDVDSKVEDEVESSSDEQQLVTVFHRVASSAAYSSNKSLTLSPNMITLSKTDATDYDEIFRKLLQCVSNMTTRPFLEELTGANVAPDADTPQADADTILTTDEDASSADANVKTRSLGSEDGFVDVSMTDEDEQTKLSESQSSIDSSKANVLERGVPIPEQLKKMFNICYMSSNDPIPTGFTTHDWSRQYPLISSRIPKPVERRNSSNSSTSVEPTDASDDSTADEPTERSVDAQMSYDANGSSDELSSMTFVKPSSNMNRRGGKHWKNRGNGRGKKFRKGKYKAPEKQIIFSPSPSEVDSAESDDVRLIRPNDVIVLDWDLDTYDALFNGHTHVKDDDRGFKTKDIAEILPDPILDRRRNRRADRRKSGVTLDECFVETSKDEILTEDNAWYCSHCKEQRLASKQLEIWTIPDILVVHLKRFGAGQNLRNKIDVLVDFPVEGLDLNGRVGVTEGKDLHYDLFAVDNHYGGLGGGHYTAFAKNFIDGEWYEYNDSTVSKRQAHSVVTSAAYLLFYRRRSSGPLGPTYLQKIVERDHQDSEVESESSSRADSPSDHGKSGNGRRLGDSSPSGSSSALIGPVAAHHRLGIGSAGANEPLLGGGGLLDDDTLPTYDEGIGMESDDRALHVTNDDGGIRSIQPNWTFATLTGGIPGDEEDNDEVASNAAADGDDEDYEGPHNKMQEDFRDDFDRGLYPSGRTSTPDDALDVPDLILPDEADHLLAVDVQESVEQPVAEVMLSENEADADGDLHLKSD